MADGVGAAGAGLLLVCCWCGWCGAAGVAAGMVWWRAAGVAVGVLWCKINQRLILNRKM